MWVTGSDFYLFIYPTTEERYPENAEVWPQHTHTHTHPRPQAHTYAHTHTYAPRSSLNISDPVSDLPTCHPGDSNPWVQLAVKLRVIQCKGAESCFPSTHILWSGQSYPTPPPALRLFHLPPAKRCFDFRATKQTHAHLKWWYWATVKEPSCTRI